MTSYRFQLKYFHSITAQTVLIFYALSLNFDCTVTLTVSATVD
jgi:hypothetical protein